MKGQSKPLQKSVADKCNKGVLVEYVMNIITMSGNFTTISTFDFAKYGWKVTSAETQGKCFSH